MTAKHTKERPILFSGPMVKAVLGGRKTQTRRVVRPRDDWYCAPEPQVQHEVRPELLESGEWGWVFQGCTYGIIGRCPYGEPGDLLWVRETWGYRSMVIRLAGSEQECEVRIEYRSDGSVRCINEPKEGFRGLPKQRPDGTEDYYQRFWRAWRPSIHMPRWASRISLEVTEVRVERLQEIDNEDAVEEGMRLKELIYRDGDAYHNARRERIYSMFATKACGAREIFAYHWNEINGKRALWESNPWVWVVGFRVLEEDR